MYKFYLKAHHCFFSLQFISGKKSIEQITSLTLQKSNTIYINQISDGFCKMSICSSFECDHNHNKHYLNMFSQFYSYDQNVFKHQSNFGNIINIIQELDLNYMYCKHNLNIIKNTLLIRRNNKMGAKVITSQFFQKT